MIIFAFKKRASVLVAAVAGLALATPSYGAQWLLDLGAFGNATAPTLGGTWNVISAPGTGDQPVTGTFPLADSTGSTTAGVELQFTDDIIDNHGSAQGTANLVPQTGPLPDNGAWVDNNVLADYLLLATSIPNNTTAFQFNNLDNSKTYSLEILGSRETTGTGRDGQFSANGLSPDNFPTGFVSQERNKTIITWAQLTPVDGSITATMSIPSGATFAYMNGMRLSEAVPEPASLGLLGTGAVALLRRRRRAARSH
jgi:hypothetical protein